jgi:hypothetical protein
MAEEPGPFDYTGLHAFVFVDHVSETDSPIEANRLRNEPRLPEAGDVRRRRGRLHGVRAPVE